jgi:nucleoside 2-deoxyribosyltransferase
MLCPTEIVYLAAPYQTAQQKTFNQRVAKLVRTYNFPLFMPEEAEEKLLDTGEVPDWQPSGHLETLTCRADNLHCFMDTCRMEIIKRSNLVLAVCHEQYFDPVTAFEVAYALGRRINVVAIQNNRQHLSVMPSVEPSVTLLASPALCHATVLAPERDDLFPDRLIPILNRYFEAHKL